jgi:uncharacterized iron-regulated membrane protein
MREKTGMAGVWPGFRAVLFWIHLILGLTAALPIFVMCVTGVVLAYKIQIETWIDLRGVKSNPSSPGARPLSAKTLVETARENLGADPESITIFRDPTGPVEIEVKGVRGPVYLDAYSGRVIGGNSRKTHELFQRFLDWHISLGVSGPHSSQFRALAGGATASALLSVVLGICLWVPRRWSWPHLRAVVLPRWGSAGRSRDFNWHNAIGIWSVIPLLIILGTGVTMSYDWARRSTNGSTGPLNTRPGSADRSMSRASTTAHDAKLLKARLFSLDDLFSRAKQQSVHWKFITAYLPRNDSDPIHFAIGMKDYIGFGSIAGLALDRTGSVVYFTPAGAGGISPSSFIRYGHTGEVWGVAGQTVAAVTTLGGVILVWTGIALSLRRWRSWRARWTTGRWDR